MTYSVSGNREQLRAQLGLARLQEVPPEQAPPTPATPAPTPGAAPDQPGTPAAIPAKPFDGLRFRW